MDEITLQQDVAATWQARAILYSLFMACSPEDPQYAGRRNALIAATLAWKAAKSAAANPPPSE